MDDFGEQNRKIIIFNWRTRKMKERNVVLILMLAFAMLAGIASGQYPSEVVKINFQQETNPVPTGYIKDYGLAFSAQNGFEYGFDQVINETRQRGTDPDPRYDTLNHLEKTNGRYWEIALDSGLYNIFLVCGDPDNTNQINTLDLEGTIVTDPDGEDEFDEYWVYNVEVTDGRLTIAPAEGSDNSKLCFIEIYVTDPAYNPPPSVEAGSDLTMWLDETAQLAGAITDEDPYDGSSTGTVTSYWVKEGGPGTVTFDPADTTDVLDPTATFDTAGTYELRLQASDGTADSNDIMTIYVRDPAIKVELAYWSFEDIIPGANTIPEFYGNDGTYVIGWGANPEDERTRFAPTVVDGVIGDSAIRFVGNQEHMLNPFVLPKEYGTLSHWCKLTSTQRGAIYFESNEDTNGWGGPALEIHSGTRDGEWMFSYCDNASEDDVNVDAGDAVVGEWSHVVATWNIHGDLVLYVDGIEEERNAMPASAVGGNIAPTENNSLFGGVSQIDDSRRYDGDLDEVQVFGWDLTIEEIRALTALGDVAPDCDAGADDSMRMRLTDTITLADAELVDYGAPSEKTIKWITDSKPADSNAIFTDDAVVNAEVQFPDFGIYVLRLTVSDAGGSDTSTIEIEIVETDCSTVMADGLGLTGDIAGGGLLGDEPDCRVTLADVAAFAADFLSCNNPQDVACEDPYL